MGGDYGNNPVAIGVCKVWKQVVDVLLVLLPYSWCQVICHSTLDVADPSAKECRVRKTATCEEVCKLMKAGSRGSSFALRGERRDRLDELGKALGYTLRDCDPEKCIAPFGNTTCLSAASLE